MKTLMISSALALVLFIFFAALPNASNSSPAGQPSCTSLFSRLADAYDGMSREMAGFRVEAAAAIVEGTIPIVELDQLTERIKSAQIRAYESIGEIVGDKGTPGAVNLTVPFYNYQGDSFLERTFYVSNSAFDRVQVSIKKTGGKNGADIAICKYDVNGNYITTKYAYIDNGSGTEGVERIVEFKGMQNEKYLTIHIVNKGGPTNKFSYRLKVTGEFNHEKLAKEKAAASPPSVILDTKPRGRN